ncbi:MAG: DUF2064 domain-containing protein [Candidatus Nanopelagicales bacterium]
MTSRGHGAGSSGPGTEPTLLVLAKEPVAGRVKTRLVPDLTPDQAARLAAAALADTLEAVMAAPARRRLVVLDGRPGDWLPAGIEVAPQVSGGLDRRLAAAFAGVRGPAVLVGMDTPQILPADLQVDFGAVDSWLGPAVDGGYWLIAMRDPEPGVFPGVPMSTSSTYQVQHARLLTSGRTVGDCRLLRDVDTIADARVVAAQVPATRFARALASFGADQSSTQLARPGC